MNALSLIVLTGKTAAGKDTLVQKLLSRYPMLRKIITTTSRPKREGEKDGVDYHFLSREEFERKIKAGEFTEHVKYGGNLYGTQKKELEGALNSHTLWRIDPSRAGEVRKFIKRSFPAQLAEKLIKRSLVIYITVSDGVVLQRLKSRGLSKAEIKKRMVDDDKIWRRFKGSYDYIVENVPGQLEETVNQITKLIESRIS